MTRLGASPRKDGKLCCCRCDARVAAHLMTRVLRPSPRWNKAQYYCPACNRRRWIFRGWMN